MPEAENSILRGIHYQPSDEQRSACGLTAYNAPGTTLTTARGLADVTCPDCLNPLFIDAETRSDLIEISELRRRAGGGLL